MVPLAPKFSKSNIIKHVDDPCFQSTLTMQEYQVGSGSNIKDYHPNSVIIATIMKIPSNTINLRKRGWEKEASMII